ncbi:MAG: hypothetical protein ACR9NN_19335 [Nostochopsis sp.]
MCVNFIIMRSLLMFVEEKGAIAICFDYLLLVGLALQLNLEPLAQVLGTRKPNHLIANQMVAF